MELQQMRYVAAIAETGSFTRAAERCLVVQSALSHQVARLEKELGARLFERNSRMVRLTDAGRAFLPAAQQAVDAAERARAEVAATVGEVSGRLAIGTIPTVAAVDLPAELGRYRVRYPRVHITVRSGSSEDLVEEVRAGSLDLAFLGVLPGFRPKGVRDMELATDELVAVVAPGHPLARAPEVDLARLAEETFVDFAEGSAARSQSEEAFQAAGLARQVAFEVTGVEFLAAFVRNGLAVGMLPSAFVAELPGVCRLSVRDAPARVERLAWGRFRPSPAAGAFLAGLGVTPGRGRADGAGG
ncbi:LysR family transcriptional regulator [Streptomyces spirodelae]|uniref:LysR family transcriptional regulator n=1 Tax=Streptomyces spirodelae TaxID=2812904 RepID=A0ABS3WRU7_9ACTN|nr:LysR family transcriptional regulator [Streptomyces spirodelae]MBO8185853.1 LysR family transcriptional regulator [Streptomyces spirodelae]